MGAYILRRLALMVPTLLGILLLNFVIIQFAPGGPVEQAIAELTQAGGGSLDRLGGGGGADLVGDGGGDSVYRGARGVDPEFIKELERQYQLDQPAHIRFLTMVGNYFTFDFGESFHKKRPVADLIWEKLPVSLTLGGWTLLIAYSVCIPLGIAKAVRDGEAFDSWTSAVIIIGYAIPQFLFAVLLVILFAGGSFWDLFPLRGLHSDNAAEMGYFDYIGDYFWHITLPIASMVVSSFATLTLLTKNSFLDEVRKQYVMTARAKGLTENRVLYGHVFRNAMLIVIAGFPAAFLALFVTGNLLIEFIFSLDGLGLLAFEAIQSRDYPVTFGVLFFYSLVTLVAHLLTDVTYTLVDPRIDFESRAG